MKGTTPWRLVVLLAAIGAVFGTTGLAAGWSSGLQHQAEDLLQPGTERSADIVVVAIDRETLAAVGEAWPWPRGRHAQLIEAIGAGGPDVVVYDVLFADPRADDSALVDAVGAAPVVLASALTLQAADGPARIVEEVVPVDALGQSAAATGHANVSLTPDRGVVRSLPLYALDDRGIVHPSLALAAVGVIEGVQQYVERPNGIQVGARFIPLAAADLQINWTDELVRGDEVTVSAIDVLEGSVEDETFEGRIVVVGVTEPTLGDLHLVPNDKSGSVSGVLVHANALNTIVNGAYLDDIGNGTQIALLVLLAVIVAAAVSWAPLRAGLLGAAALVAVVIAFSAWRFHAAGELWNVVWPIATIIVVALAGSAARYAGEIRHRRRAAALFSSYVPAGTLDQLADPAILDRAVAGERLLVTVLFCDLRGFTPTAANLTAEEVRRLLDAYYAYAVEIISAHNGTVMQFVGDEVFAAFGAPVAAPDDTERARTCARALVARIDELDRRLTNDSLPTTRFGIGLHRGEVVAAHVGGRRHRQYAVIGDTVNVGSRLCSQAGAGEIVLSDAAADEFDTTGMTRIEGMDLKGIDEPVAGWRIG